MTDKRHSRNKADSEAHSGALGNPTCSRGPRVVFYRVAASILVTSLLLTLFSYGSVAIPVAPIFAAVPAPRGNSAEGAFINGVFGDDAIGASTLTVVYPNGGEVLHAGAMKPEPILWNFAGLTEDVRLEYSTDGTATWKTIIDATPGTAGAYSWTVPKDPSTDAYVRVISTLDATISDTSDLPFTIFGGYTFGDSYAWVNPVSVKGGETVSYNVVLYEFDTANLLLTDTLPSSLTYVTESLRVDPVWKNEAQIVAGEIRWSDVVTGAVPVAITFRAQVVQSTSTFTIVNPIRVSRDGALLELDVLSIVNGYPAFLPVVVRNP